MSDLRILRDRVSDVNDRIDRMGDDRYGSAAIVGTTTTITTYPTSGAAYYGIAVGNITSPEIEGQPGTVTTIGTTILALNLGTQVPPVGTKVICHAAGGRWEFRYDG